MSVVSRTSSPGGMDKSVNSYKSQILGKFAKRINNELIRSTERAIQEKIKHEEPMITETPVQVEKARGRKFDDIPPRPNFGELRSVDRLSEIQKKKMEESQRVAQYRELSKSWEQRRGRSDQSDKVTG